MSIEKKATIEMGGGALLTTVGIFMSQFPLAGVPEMPNFIVHLIISAGLAAILCGALFFLVGAGRYTDATWPNRLVERWDEMWTKQFMVWFLPICAALIIGIALILDARAQSGSSPATTPMAPSSHTSNGPCSTVIGGNNSGNINPDCRSYNYGPPRRDQDIIQDGRVIGLVGGIQKRAGSYEATINSLTINRDFDTLTPIDVKGMLLSCKSISEKENNHNPNRIITIAGDVKCKVVGMTR